MFILNEKDFKIIKIQIPAGQANPSPPVGPALGQHGVNIMDFCKKFNSYTKDKSGSIIPVIIKVYKNKSFTFITKQPYAVTLIKKMAGLSLDKKPGSGAKTSGKEIVAKLTIKQLREIAESKKSDLNSYDVESAMKIISGTAKSMGVEIIKTTSN